MIALPKPRYKVCIRTVRATGVRRPTNRQPLKSAVNKVDTLLADVDENDEERYLTRFSESRGIVLARKSVRG